MSIEYETTTSRARYINKSTSIVACWCSGRFQKQGTAVRNSYQYLQFLWLFFYQLLIVHKSKDFKEIVWSKNDLTKRNRQVIILRIFDWFCQSVVKNRNLNLCKKRKLKNCPELCTLKESLSTYNCLHSRMLQLSIGALRFSIGQSLSSLVEGGEGSYISAQVVSCCVYEHTKQQKQCIKGNNQSCLTIGQIRAFTSFY